MPKKIKVGAAILADYVALGHANKITIVNAFSGDIVLSQLPADVGFGIYMELTFGEDRPPDNLTIEAILDGTKVLEGRATTATGSGEMGTVAIPNLPFHVEKNCYLELYISAKGYQRTLALKKSIKQGVIPSG